MANLFKTAIESVFESNWLPSVDGGVAVVNGDNTAMGIVDYNTDVEVGNGIDAKKSGQVRVLSDDVGTVDIDGIITVDGVRVFVTAVNPDAANAIVTIQFSQSQPVPEEML